MNTFPICIVLAVQGMAAFFVIAQSISGPALHAGQAATIVTPTRIEQHCSPEAFDQQELMDRPELQAVAYRLFYESFAFPRERAVWVTYKNGEFGFVYWPFPGGPNRAAWNGPVPICAVAVLHTHLSKESSEPCPADHDLADGRQTPDVRLPVYVLHRNSITKAVPGNSQSVRVRELGWVNDFAPQARGRSISH